MFHRVTCPTCQHKFTVREASMGQRQTCPNCQSHFLAGKSVAEEEAPIPMTLQTPAPAATNGAGINKTMLAEPEPPIRYNCPRCKKPLESPSSEAGTKKPCPACGQRLQIPVASKPAPPPPNLNKTMLAADTGAGSAAAFQAGQPIPAATTAEPAPKPKAPLSRYAMAGIAGGGLLLVGLFACVIAMFFSGGAEREKFLKAQQDFANAQKELADLKKSMQEKAALMAQKKQMEMEHQQKWDRMMEEQKARMRELELQRELDKKNLAYQTDQDLAAKIKEKRRQEEEDIKRQERDRLADQKKLEMEMKMLKAQLEADNRKATVIISQPPPPVYYPRYDPRYYWGW